MESDNMILLSVEQKSLPSVGTTNTIVPPSLVFDQLTKLFNFDSSVPLRMEDFFDFSRPDFTRGRRSFSFPPEEESLSEGEFSVQYSSPHESPCLPNSVDYMLAVEVPMDSSCIPNSVDYKLAVDADVSDSSDSEQDLLEFEFQTVFDAYLRVYDGMDSSKGVFHFSGNLKYNETIVYGTDKNNVRVQGRGPDRSPSPEGGTHILHAPVRLSQSAYNLLVEEAPDELPLVTSYDAYLRYYDGMASSGFNTPGNPYDINHLVAVMKASGMEASGKRGKTKKSSRRGRGRGGKQSSGRALKRVIDKEIDRLAQFKYVDAITTSPTAVTTSGVIGALFNVGQGTQDGQRIGDAVKIDTITLGTCEAFAFNSDIVSHMRMILFQWLPNIADFAPTVADILETPTVNSCFSLLNVEHSPEYIVLYDRLFTFIGTATVPTDRSDHVMKNKRVRRPPKRVVYEATSSSGSSGTICILLLSDSAASPNPAISYAFRAWYKDTTSIGAGGKRRLVA